MKVNNVGNMVTDRTSRIKQSWQYKTAGGCRLYPDCFTCPYEECVEGTRHGRTIGKEIRYFQIREMAGQGIGKRKIAQIFGVSNSTVRRAMNNGD